MRARPLALAALVLLLAGAGRDGRSAPASSVAAIGGVWPPPERELTWHAPGASPEHTTTIRLLAFNDLHGNLARPSLPSPRPVGGAAVLAAYLEAAERGAPGRTLIVHAGDELGASPPLTRLLRNEPAVQFLDLLANESCPYGGALEFHDAARWREHPNRCNLIGTLGNHEFDAGLPELRRLLRGGNATDGPFLENPYRGSRIPYVCANVRDRRTGRPIAPPYAVVVVGGVPIGVIGAVVRQTPMLVPAWAVQDVDFLDEAESINRAAAELHAHGIRTLIVAIHQGLVPVGTPEGWDFRGPLRQIIARLDPGIDVVISGHTHNYTLGLLPDRTGRPVLVTQAYYYGVAYAQIDLQIDPDRDAVVSKSATIHATWADEGPGLHPDERVAALTQAASGAVESRIARIVGRAAAPVTRQLTPAGESALGDLVADAQRTAMHSDIALMNAGGLRADLAAGPITWGDILTVHPFGNRLLTLQLTGAQLLQVLEQQWSADPSALPRVLKTSGLFYAYDPVRPVGHRVVAACDAAYRPLEPARLYEVTVNDFLEGGGDGFVRLEHRPVARRGPLDSEALAQYLEARHGAIAPYTDGRIALARAGLPLPCGELRHPAGG